MTTITAGRCDFQRKSPEMAQLALKADLNALNAGTIDAVVQSVVLDRERALGICEFRRRLPSHCSRGELRAPSRRSRHRSRLGRSAHRRDVRASVRAVPRRQFAHRLLTAWPTARSAH